MLGNTVFHPHSVILLKNTFGTSFADIETELGRLQGATYKKFKIKKERAWAGWLLSR